MKYCSYCGTKLLVGINPKFCHECGHKLLRVEEFTKEDFTDKENSVISNQLSEEKTDNIKDSDQLVTHKDNNKIDANKSKIVLSEEIINDFTFKYLVGYVKGIQNITDEKILYIVSEEKNKNGQLINDFLLACGNDSEKIVETILQYANREKPKQKKQETKIVKHVELPDSIVNSDSFLSFAKLANGYSDKYIFSMLKNRAKLDHWAEYVKFACKNDEAKIAATISHYASTKLINKDTSCLKKNPPVNKSFIESKTQLNTKNYKVNSNSNLNPKTLETSPHALYKEEDLQEWFSNDIIISGTTYENRQDIISKLKDDTPIYLVREPENKYDKNAIAVYEGASNQKIGYIPREYRNTNNSHLSIKMDKGEKVYAVIYEICGNNNFSHIVVRKGLPNYKISRGKFPYQVRILLSENLEEVNNRLQSFKNIKWGYASVFGLNKLGVTKATCTERDYFNIKYVCKFIYNNLEDLDILFNSIELGPKDTEYPIYQLKINGEKISEYPVALNRLEYLVFFKKSVSSKAETIANKRWYFHTSKDSNGRLDYNIRFESPISPSNKIKIGDAEWLLHNSRALDNAYILNLDTGRIEIYKGGQKSPNFSSYLKIDEREIKTGFYNAMKIAEFDIDLIPERWFVKDVENNHPMLPLVIDSLSEDDIIKKLDSLMNERYAEYDSSSIWDEYNEDGLPYEDMK